jgi:Domain of unknown function (DUF5753)
MASAFTILDFPKDPRSEELLEPPLVYVDTLTGAMYLNKPDEVDAYELAWRGTARPTPRSPNIRGDPQTRDRVGAVVGSP